MKINAKYFDIINTEPIEIQETSNGKIEIHYLNDYPMIYNAYISRGQFTCWSNKGGTDYKLLIEKSFCEEMKDLYCKEINELWLEFYNYVAEAKKKAFVQHFLPLSIIMMVLIFLLNAFIPEAYSTVTLISSVVLIMIYFLGNNYLKLRANRAVGNKKNQTVDKIEELLGKDRFNEILDLQEKFTKDFFEQRKAEYEESKENDENLLNEGEINNEDK